MTKQDLKGFIEVFFLYHWRDSSLTVFGKIVVQLLFLFLALVLAPFIIIWVIFETLFSLLGKIIGWAMFKESK
jgi:hypothetical protein